MESLTVNIAAYWSQYIWPFMMFIIGLGLVVFVHELGHFLAAKWAGVKVEEFALGFGKKILGFRRGETLYRLNAVPIGGYVKMLGQDDFNAAATAEDDSRSWQRAPAGKKLVILSAGVAMNVVFSVIVFVIVYMIGIRFVAPVVGSTQPDFPAATAVLPDEVAEAMGTEKAVGLREGDQITAINGKEIRRFNQLQMAAILSSKEDVFHLTMARNVNGQRVLFDVMLVPREVKSGPMFDKFGTHYAFGISPSPNTMIEKPGKEGYAGKEHFKKSDRIVEIAGKPIENFWDMSAALWAGVKPGGKEVEFVVERKGRRVSVTVTPPEVWGNPYDDSKELLNVLGMSPRIRVAVVVKDSPAAAAGLKAGDVITDYAGDGAPSHVELLEINKNFANTETSIRVLRNGKVLDLKITPATNAPKDDRVLIGIGPAPEQDKPYVANVTDGSPAAEADVAEGAVITKVNDTPVATWAELCAAMRLAGDKKVALTYTLAGKEQTVEIGVLTKKMFDPDGYELGTSAIAGFFVLKTDLIQGSPAQALGWGAEDTTAWIISVYKSLRNIFKGRASTKGLSGPVGIGAIAIKMGREGVIDLAYFIAMLSALVAVFNFLPLPVLDGGHVVLVLIEKVRGRPLPTKVLVGIQIAGFVLIGGIFLAITFQDIARHVFGN